jgi:uncharacterized DUF497 family protein
LHYQSLLAQAIFCAYNKSMRITFDTVKNAINIEKHGMSLVDAERIEWDTLRAMTDTRQDYGEVRMIGYALIQSRLHVIVYTDRASERRIISLRKANKREVQNYVAND